MIAASPGAAKSPPPPFKTPHIVLFQGTYTKYVVFCSFYSDEFFDGLTQTLYKYQNNKQEIQ
jgi:hypothetical protein